MSSNPTIRIENDNRPGWGQRLLAVVFYFGFAPWLWRVCLRGERRFLNLHFAQALVIAFLFLAVLGYGAGVFLWSSSLLANRPEAYRAMSQSLFFQFVTEALLHILFVAWLAVWAIALILAACGSMVEMPVVAWLARRKIVTWVSFTVCSPVYFALLLLVGVGLHASSLTDRALRPAPVYMLYDDLGYVPGWVFDLGMYRISRAAKSKWGRDSVVVAPLNDEALEMALAHGRFVFVASHGNDGYINTAEMHYGPEDVARDRLGRDLQFVYLAACNAGDRAREWVRVFAPTEVYIYDRKSYLYEHVRWLWSLGPAKIHELD